MFWLRPGVASSPQGMGWLTSFGRGRCAALFDVDGVLIDVSGSFRRSVAAASATLVAATLGDVAPAALAGAPTPLIADDDIHRFKLAGGFNNDWDLVLALTALWVARLREWRGQPQARVTLAEWAALAGAAALAGQGGVAWLRSVAPASAIPTPHDARWVHEEYYWGDTAVRAVYGHTPRYAPDAPGFAHTEEPLLEAALLPALARQGVTHFGLITGRDGPEVTAALRLLAPVVGLRDHATEPAADARTSDATGDVVGGASDVADDATVAPILIEWADGAYGRSPFGAIVPSSLYTKPDPRGLAHAIHTLGAEAALYVGDTADDLNLVLRYRAELGYADPGLPQTLAVMVAEGATAATYQERGADILLTHIRELPAALTALAT